MSLADVSTVLLLHHMDGYHAGICTRTFGLKIDDWGASHFQSGEEVLDGAIVADDAIELVADFQR